MGGENMNYISGKRTIMSLAVASACGLSAISVQAQQPAEPPAKTTAAETPASKDAEKPVPEKAKPKDAPPDEVIIVTGIRASLAKAAELKREVTGIRDSIVAEDIGKFPEQNLADALAQLPGVEVIKDPISNEGQSIRLRGLGVNQTITSLNGAMVRTTSTGKIGGGFREFSYDVLPSELFKRVDIYKTPLAELQEGGIGGVIDLQTPRPFDRKGFVGSFAVTGVNNTNDGKTNPRGNLFLSNTWGNFGALIAITGSKANNGNAGALNSTGSWITSEYGAANGGNRIAWNTTTSSGTGGLTLAQLNSGFLPRLIRIFAQESERERVGLNTSLQYKTKDFDISYDVLYAKLNDDVKDNFVNWSAGDSTGTGRALIPISVRLDGNNNLNGTIGNWVQRNFSRTFLNESKFIYQGVNATYKASDTWRLKGQLAFSKGDAWRNTSLMTAEGDTTAASRQTLNLNFGNPLGPQLQSNVSLLDPTTLTAFSYSGGYSVEKDKQNFLNLVSENNWYAGQFEGLFKVGYNLAKSTKTVVNYNAINVLNNYVIPGINRTYANATAAERIAFMRPFLVPNDASAVSRLGSSGVPGSWLVFNRDFIYGTLNALEQNRSAPIVPNTSYESTETTSTFFVQSDIDTQVFGRKLAANVGVRLVQTKTDSDTVAQALGGGWTPINPTSSYNNTLPAASVSYDITDKIVARAAYGETITRGPINRIAGAVRIPNVALLAVELGNPSLLPEKSKGTDFALEFYPNRSSVLAANVFEREISGSVQTTTVLQPFSSLGLDPLLWQPTQAAQLAGTPSTPISVTTFTNNPASYKIKGFELQYSQTFTFLPAPFNGLGGTASYTKVDVVNRTKSIGVSSGARDAAGNLLFTNQSFNMPNLPPETIALSLFYEKGPISTRVSYTKRAAYANDGSNDMNGVGFQRWFNERAYTNLAFGYKPFKGYELRFDVLNLTKTKVYEYFKNYDPSLAGQRGSDESRTENGFIAGRTYQLTLRGTF
jgi:iron complex outermembrane recepter protein